MDIDAFKDWLIALGAIALILTLIVWIVQFIRYRNSSKASVPGVREELERVQATRNETTFQSRSQRSQQQVFLIPEIRPSPSPPPYQTCHEHSVPVVFVIPLDELDHLPPLSYDQATCGIDYYSPTIK